MRYLYTSMHTHHISLGATLCMCTCIHAHAHTCTQARAHTHTHTHAHTHTYTHTHKRIQGGMLYYRCGVPLSTSSSAFFWNESLYKPHPQEQLNVAKCRIKRGVLDAWILNHTLAPHAPQPHQEDDSPQQEAPQDQQQHLRVQQHSAQNSKTVSATQPQDANWASATQDLLDSNLALAGGKWGARGGKMHHNFSNCHVLARKWKVDRKWQ